MDCYGLLWTLCHYSPTSQDVPIDGIWVALGAAARAGRQWIWGGPAGSGTMAIYCTQINKS